MGLVPPSQELGRSCTVLPPFPSRLLCLSLLPLYPYCITTWEICQEVFSTFFGFQLSCESNRNPASLTALDFSYIVSHIGRFVKREFREFFPGRNPCGIAVAGLYLCPSLLTLQIISHLPLDCNRQNAQNRDFYFLKLCATFLLTKVAWCVIMEFSAAATVSGRLKKPPHTLGRSKCGAGKIQFKFSGCLGSHPLLPFHKPLHASPLCDYPPSPFISGEHQTIQINL